MSRVPIVGVVGARPNFMKMAPVARLLRRHPGFRFHLVHTGQHYAAMSDPFFRELALPDPEYHLGAGSGDAAEQIARIMTRLVPVLRKLRPRLVLVAGDVNSTLAAALTAHKMGLPVGHIEAGLRSFDDSMPEEVNRRLTDAVSDYCFTPSADADRNLRREGVPPERIVRVGNLMIDTLRRFRKKAAGSNILKTLGLRDRSYALVTLHRPSNVDSEEKLSDLVAVLRKLSGRLSVVFPIHPRTWKSGLRIGLWSRKDRVGHGSSAPRSRNGLVLTEPLGYFDFLKLQSRARVVLTDSGGVQEETTVLGVPCLTLRENTERPVTITHGTNRLAGTDPGRILDHVERILAGDVPPRRTPPLWDGRSAERLIRVLERKYLRR
ncbi:MAG TPA: UDP-N-acetylglucosamine 2-epimerase (non-hydrolyzing) [Planctomycetota bacterium]|nr:UDP-N-acetylglucosamine 2-epimerase (non-hydrolyzing) [Planctomycetota bacterium]